MPSGFPRCTMLLEPSITSPQGMVVSVRNTRVTNDSDLQESPQGNELWRFLWPGGGTHAERGDAELQRFYAANCFGKTRGNRACRLPVSRGSDRGSCGGTRLIEKSSLVADRSSKVLQPVREAWQSAMVPRGKASIPPRIICYASGFAVKGILCPAARMVRSRRHGKCGADEGAP
jgi:hypothetical protein